MKPADVPAKGVRSVMYPLSRPAVYRRTSGGRPRRKASWHRRPLRRRWRRFRAVDARACS
jgi:hypothetical protein